MNLYEILTLLLALIGAVTGLTSLVRTRVIAEKQLEYQAIAAALAKRQLEALIRQEATTSKAEVTVDLVKVGRTDFRFVVSNRGLAPATDVNLEISPSGPDNPLVKGELDRKLPFPKLEPGQSFTLTAALHLRSAMQYPVRLSWRDPNGGIERRDVHVAL
jgi:hypothetical protein